MGYFPTFTIKINHHVGCRLYIPYMDPMGLGIHVSFQGG